MPSWHGGQLSRGCLGTKRGTHSGAHPWQLVTATGSAGEMKLIVTASKNCSARGMPSCQPGAGLPPTGQTLGVTPGHFHAQRTPPGPSQRDPRRDAHQNPILGLTGAPCNRFRTKHAQQSPSPGSTKVQIRTEPNPPSPYLQLSPPLCQSQRQRRWPPERLGGRAGPPERLGGRAGSPARGGVTPALTGRRAGRSPSCRVPSSFLRGRAGAVLREPRGRSGNGAGPAAERDRRRSGTGSGAGPAAERGGCWSRYRSRRGLERSGAREGWRAAGAGTGAGKGLERSRCRYRAGRVGEESVPVLGELERCRCR